MLRIYCLVQHCKLSYLAKANYVINTLDCSGVSNTKNT
jgi:hypothetical protein